MQSKAPITGDVHMIFGDCIEKLNMLPDACVDLVLCDLPYESNKDIREGNSAIPRENLWKQYDRVCRPDAAVVLMTQTPYDKILGVSNLSNLRYEWIWRKSIATGFLNVNRAPLKDHETRSAMGPHHTTVPRPQHLGICKQTTGLFPTKITRKTVSTEGKQRSQCTHA